MLSAPTTKKPRITDSDADDGTAGTGFLTVVADFLSAAASSTEDMHEL